MAGTIGRLVRDTKFISGTVNPDPRRGIIAGPLFPRDAFNIRQRLLFSFKRRYVPNDGKILESHCGLAMELDGLCERQHGYLG